MEEKTPLEGEPVESTDAVEEVSVETPEVAEPVESVEE